MYDIPDEMLIEHPGLVYLLLYSTSLSSAEEKQEWFNTYHAMDNEQVLELYKILMREGYQLSEIKRENHNNSQNSSKTIYDFSEGLAEVELNDKWGFIDKTGKEVITCKYDYAKYFHEGRAKVRLNGRDFYIDKNGQKINY
ncbi:MAG: WG repeat-containing protein [Prevotella sp.]|uniref:WG repeat-containing protein n=1 Tax=Prevotella sp. TaxID=59823 RepID=UPI002A26F8DE|nr:WG repeat-containing protein [Prevotella sp.]MDD7319119.1 WG repeat-containing protein [Prevotellaceae bacterium]MDY4019606.1 WG repeat-containing protein [Prevotella sp.]